MFWLDCVDPHAENLPELQRRFAHAVDDDPVHDGLGVNEPPTVHVLTASETNSLPVTLWRTDRCAEHPPAEDDCAGSKFRQRLLTRLGGVPPTEWHTTIWQEQVRSDGSPDRDDFWRKIIYILDKPG